MAAKGDTEQPAAVETQGRLAVAASSIDKLGLQTNAGCGWVGVMRRCQGQYVCGNGHGSASLAVALTIRREQ